MSDRLDVAIEPIKGLGFFATVRHPDGRVETFFSTDAEGICREILQRIATVHLKYPVRCDDATSR